MEALTTKFEGPEKKLEIILFSPQPNLRSNKDGRWDRVVRASRSMILSKASTDDLDAYLLSESSLFVWDDRILMITCGKTTLIQALPEILNIVEKRDVAFVFYERKNNLFPKEQPSTFEDDVNLMVKYFPGKYYTLGPINDDHVHVFYSSHANADASDQDATLQLLMHNLDASAMDVFCEKNVATPIQARKQSGLDSIYSFMKKDSYLFSPCGYSLNGISEDRYFTIHVTPQPTGSFASFETNVIETDYSGIIRKVISVFNPGKFSLVLTTTLDDDSLLPHYTITDAVPGYCITDKTFYEFDCGYGVTFLNYKTENRN